MTTEPRVTEGDVALQWCVNIHGPDDVFAVGSYVEAVRAANIFNEWWEGYRKAKPLHEQFDARMWAVPIEWPHDAESHAASLTNKRDEYQWVREKLATPVSAGGGSGLRDALEWIETWVSNPVGSYSVQALDGLFAMTRDRIHTALSAPSGELGAVAWQQIAQFLWDRLDAIDTLDDACKGDDAAFRKAVYPIQRRRFEVGSTDADVRDIWQAMLSASPLQDKESSRG